MADAVVLDGALKCFGAKRAVDALSLCVPAGCIYGFLGPNGAGKTTIIRMIMGILRPDAGRVAVLGCEDPAKVKDRLGYLPEEKGLYRQMRVGKLMSYFGQLKGMDARRARKRAEEMLVQYGLGEWIDRRCAALSRGMSQKLQLLATLIHEPEVVILDEPFSGLDPVNRDLMREAILDLKRRGCSVILSTHIMEQAEQICDCIVLIDRGRKLLEGPLNAVRAGGGRAVLLEYEGEGALLRRLPGVRRVDDAGRRAELFLEEGADPQAVLAALVGQVRIRCFDLREPSLHEIFIRAVGARADAP